MGTLDINDIVGKIFRANPRYKLIPFDGLSSYQKDILASIRDNPLLYGVLAPIDGESLTFKSVCHETADLFLELANSSPIPDRFRSDANHKLNQDLAELVLDEILEIASPLGFVSGMEAYPIIFVQKEEKETTDRFSRISIEALQYAAALEINEVSKLSARIYFYNRIPVTPHWKNLWPDKNAVLQHLLQQNGLVQNTQLAKDYVLQQSASTYRGWLMWTHRNHPPVRLKNKVFYKLYLSPLPQYIREVFEALKAILPFNWCPHFKIGCDAFGLLRSDKIVCYFEGFDNLMQFAEALKLKLSGCPSQGVPFSASLNDNGLLSWGIDPPYDDARPVWMESESWRLWVSNRLASALVTARGKSDLPVEPWRFAIERLRLSGVDTETWTPNESIWLRTIANKR